MDGLPADIDGDCGLTTDSVLHDAAAIPRDQDRFAVATRPIGARIRPTDASRRNAGYFAPLRQPVKPWAGIGFSGAGAVSRRQDSPAIGRLAVGRRSPLPERLPADLKHRGVPP